MPIQVTEHLPYPAIVSYPTPKREGSHPNSTAILHTF
jgi:hypothetical protein